VGQTGKYLNVLLSAKAKWLQAKKKRAKTEIDSLHSSWLLAFAARISHILYFQD
jgi:hypothetical protein